MYKLELLNQLSYFQTFNTVPRLKVKDSKKKQKFMENSFRMGKQPIRDL